MKKLFLGSFLLCAGLGLGAPAVAQTPPATKLVMTELRLPKVIKLTGDDLELRVVFKVEGPMKASFAPVHARIEATSNGTPVRLGGNDLELTPAPSGEPATLVAIAKVRITDGGKPRPIDFAVDAGAIGKVTQHVDASNVVSP